MESQCFQGILCKNFFILTPKKAKNLPKNNFQADLCYKILTKYKVKCNNHTKDNPIITKGFEIVLFDVTHQEFDGKDRHQKCHNHANGKNHNFTAKQGAFEQKLQHFQKAGSAHHGNRQKEGIFRCNKSGRTNQHRSQNGRTGTGSAGNQGQKLKQADVKSSFIRKLCQTVDLR